MAEAMAAAGQPVLAAWRRPPRARSGGARPPARWPSGSAVAPDRVVFTSGGTEANNLALLGCRRPRLVSAIEHASVLEAVPGRRHASRSIARA